MNERFFSLPAERQGASVSAAYAVFAADSYRHAATGDTVALDALTAEFLECLARLKRQCYREEYR